MSRSCVTFLITLISYTAQAQFFIPKIGWASTYNTESFTNASTNHTYKTTGKTGPVIGIGLNARMGDRMSFQPEVYYVQKNFDYSYLNTSTELTSGVTTSQDNTDKYKISYLEIPLLLKYKFVNEKIFLTLGPYMAIGLGGSHSYNYIHTETGGVTPPTGNTKSGSNTIVFGKAAQANSNFNEFDKRTELGIQPGIGIVVAKKVLVELRHDFQINNLYTSRNSKNQTFLLTLSYPISLIPEDE